MTLKDFLDDWNSPSPTLTVHTSGSTGSPKPMEVEKQKMLNSARITCDFLHLRPGDRALLCMSLDYIAGKMMVVRSLERGLRLVSVEPTGHPFATLAHEEPEERAQLMRSRHLIIGGGAIDAELERELQNFPHAVWSTYGMTETLSHVALRRLNGQEASQWYKPFSHVGISQTAEGCLVVDAPLVHDGPLVTNDRVEIHGNRFRILGRKDNVVCSEAVKETCRRVLPKYWQPKHYYHLEHLPMTATGKPARGIAEKWVEDENQK